MTTMTTITPIRLGIRALFENNVCPIPKQSEFDDYIGASISTCLELHKSHPPNEHFLIFLTGQKRVRKLSIYR